MKKLVIFFCDINGTIDGFKKNSKVDYQEFNFLLKELKEKNQADILLFSLVSNEKKEIVSEYNNIMCSFLDERITIGKQFCDVGYLESNRFSYSIKGKIWQMINYINELKNIYYIQKIYLADDTEMNSNILLELLEFENMEKFESIVPRNMEGLSELNSLIKTNMFSTTKKKTLQKKFN
ncbi:MAG: hypothetical protein ACI31M_02075 [Bacilli bacterium]